MPSEPQKPLIRTEVVLRRSDAGDEIHVHDKRLSIGDVIQIADGTWRVSSEEEPTRIGTVARYVCHPG